MAPYDLRRGMAEPGVLRYGMVGAWMFGSWCEDGVVVDGCEGGVLVGEFVPLPPPYFSFSLFSPGLCGDV